MSDIQWNMVNGSTLNFSEIGKLDSMSYFPAQSYDDSQVVLFGGGRGGGKTWTLENNRAVFDTEFLTQPEKKDNINPSKLLVKLIGRISED